MQRHTLPRNLTSRLFLEPLEARNLLEQALTDPAARLLGPNGPAVLPLVRDRLAAIVTGEE